jgi:SAM-dependent methyltransferase
VRAPLIRRHVLGARRALLHRERLPRAHGARRHRRPYSFPLRVCVVSGASCLENGFIVINELGLFIQQRVPQRQPRARFEGPHLPWQYRSAVEWWPDVAPGDAEARLLLGFAERVGGPTLEVGFGSGQRLLACRTAGLDIDGVEISPGLHAACRERFAERGHSGHRLYLQPLHELDLPRRYRSIYAGRVLGTGASREADALGLCRLYRALEPGGSLLIDHPAPSSGPSRWTSWWGGGKRPWPPALADAELVSPSGAEVLRLSSQLFEHAPEAASLSYTVRARLFEQGELRLSRGFALRQCLYTPREVIGLLCCAGFEARHINSLCIPEAARQLWVAEKPVAATAPPKDPLGPIGQAGLIAMRFGGGAT